MPSAAPPTDLQRYFDKGVQAYTQGFYDYAIDLLLYVIKQAPDATEARRYLRLAIQKQYTQSPPSMLFQLGSMVLGAPLLAAATFHCLRGQPQQAIALYEQLLRLQPRSKTLLMQLAGALQKSKMDDAAMAAYEELLGLDTNHLPALRALARLSLKRGKDQQARHCFERVMSLAPNDVEAQQSLRNLDALGTIKKSFSL